MEEGTMAEQFAPGDVVVLKSGGPSMTIESIEDDEAACVWFQAQQQRSGSFKLFMLEKPGLGFA
jgi:uncharacterized protein YodC (DUF2158 family)